MYEMATGRLPFAGASPSETVIERAGQGSGAADGTGAAAQARSSPSSTGCSPNVRATAIRTRPNWPARWRPLVANRVVDQRTPPAAVPRVVTAPVTTPSGSPRAFTASRRWVWVFARSPARRSGETSYWDRAAASPGRLPDPRLLACRHRREIGVTKAQPNPEHARVIGLSDIGDRGSSCPCTLFPIVTWPLGGTPSAFEHAPCVVGRRFHAEPPTRRCCYLRRFRLHCYRT